jgi:DNA processing protein
VANISIFVVVDSRPTSTQYLIALTRIPGVGDVLAKKLIAYSGSPEAVFKQSRSALEKIPNIGRTLSDAIHRCDALKQAEGEVEFAMKHGVSVIPYFEKTYPDRLKHCIDSPLLLYFKGKTDLNAPRMVSIVGTRNATRHGKELTEKLTAELVAAGVTIVSGLAFGIDIAAHKATLKAGGTTIAVLAHGLDRIYPQEHASIAKEMMLTGALISEFPTGTKPDRENFPKRNRVVAGMTDATIVVEAGIKGGALITAELANSYNRDVFAVPGRVSDTYSEGCNRLIMQNKAALITSAEDVLQQMNWTESSKTVKANPQKRLLIDLTTDQEKVVAVLQVKEARIDELALSAGLSLNKVASVLLELEFEGIVSALPGKVYRLA